VLPSQIEQLRAHRVDQWRQSKFIFGGEREAQRREAPERREEGFWGGCKSVLFGVFSFSWFIFGDTLAQYFYWRRWRSPLAPPGSTPLVKLVLRCRNHLYSVVIPNSLCCVLCVTGLCNDAFSFTYRSRFMLQRFHSSPNSHLYCA